MSTEAPAERVPLDAYPTPDWAIRAFLPYLGNLRDLNILEPACGEGAIVRELIRAGATPRRIVGIDIDVQALLKCPPEIRTGGADFVDTNAPPLPAAFNLVITNPPYTLALEFVQRSLSLLRAGGGRVAMLLRLNFLGSQERNDFFTKHTPDVYVLSRRPGFRADMAGKTDRTEYAWFVWHRDAAPAAGALRVIPLDACFDSDDPKLAKRRR